MAIFYKKEKTGKYVQYTFTNFYQLAYYLLLLLLIYLWIPRFPAKIIIGVLTFLLLILLILVRLPIAIKAHGTKRKTIEGSIWNLKKPLTIKFEK